MILDMRNNPGGLVNEAEASDELLSAGVIFSTRHRSKVIEEAKAHEGGAFASLPVVALVNEYSASAAELVAGALQDSGRAMLVGATTFGKGSVQTIYELPGGAGVSLTTMRYYTPNGRSIQAQGIKPDVLIERGAAGPGRHRPRAGSRWSPPRRKAIGDRSPRAVLVEKRADHGRGRRPRGRHALRSHPAGADFTLTVGHQRLPPRHPAVRQR